MHSTDRIPFNRPYATGNELAYLTEAQRQSHLSGDGSFTRRCHQGTLPSPKNRRKT